MPRRNRRLPTIVEGLDICRIQAKVRNSNLESTYLHTTLMINIIRTAIIYHMIDTLIDIHTNVPCPTTGGLDALPLPSGKTLWNALSEEEWVVEYELRLKQRLGRANLTYGNLIQLQRDSGGSLSDVTLLENWYSDMDSFGHMVMVAATLL